MPKAIAKKIKKPMFAPFGRVDWCVLGKSFNLATGLGFTIAIPIVFGILAGLFLDNKIGAKPLFTLGFMIIGILASVYGAVRFIRENL